MKASENSKKKLHPRNKHNDLYDFALLQKEVPELSEYVILNPNGQLTINFAIPEALVLLNKALLKTYYKMTFWELPKTNLCPPIPGRADYIHHIADLLAEGNNGKIPTGKAVKILDIGTGASMIYPIIGVAEYGWQFVATEIDQQSIGIAQHLIDHNSHLKQHVRIKKQDNKRHIVKNIFGEKEYFDVVMSNPPFFKSKEEALSKTALKLKNLGKEVGEKPVQNFSGQNNELWCEGGELAFITNYIFESKHVATQALWFTSLVSNKEHIKKLQTVLNKVQAKEVRIIHMEQGNKISRILAWRF